jgi:hypothetical protein
MLASWLFPMDINGKLASLGERHLTDRTELCELMSTFGSDKGGPFHNYTIVYDLLFSTARTADLSLFELGLGTNKVGAPSSMGPGGRPGASLRAWQAYFPHAAIYGADIDSDILFQEEHIRTYWTDQRSPDAVRDLWDMLGDIQFDIMIDDGLHEASANICFFMESFARLKPGGVYVVEDITPRDAELMSSFARCLAPLSRSLFCGALHHPQNAVDNRLLIFQKA